MLERVIDFVIFVLVACLAIVWHYLSLLPPIIQGGLIAAIFVAIIYITGWNDAVAAVRDETIDKANDDYQRRRR